MKINKTWIGLKILLSGGAIAFLGLFLHQEKGDVGSTVALIGILIGIAGGIFHTVHTLKALATPEE